MVVPTNRGFKEEEIKDLRTKGCFHEGGACYITGKGLNKEKSIRGQEFDENAVYAVDYVDGGADYMCQLAELGQLAELVTSRRTPCTDDESKDRDLKTLEKKENCKC